MFQLSQESSVIYQEAVPLNFCDDGDLPRRRFYRYVRTKTTSSSTSSSSVTTSYSHESHKSSNGAGGGVAAPARPLANSQVHNLLPQNDADPPRKASSRRQYSSSSSNDYYLHVSCRTSSPHKVERPSCGPGPPTPLYNSWAIAKKGSVRNNGEILKRSRIQTAYELSQDLQDKRIEMLERKYGGQKARLAALTIQRAFRRYTLLKKFAAITAMAKAEKRLSRRLQKEGEICQGDGSVAPGSTVVVNGSVSAVHVPGVHPAGGAPGAASSRTVPIRSLSMRERRKADYAPLPRSQSGCCGDVNACAQLHQQYDYYSSVSVASCQPCQPCPHDNSVTYWESASTHYYSPHESYSEHDMNTSLGPVCPEPLRRAIPPIMSPPHVVNHNIAPHPAMRQPSPMQSQPVQYNHTPIMESCGVSAGAWPHHADSYSNSPSSSPAGSVASYQMRPQHRKVPPDVPKRTSSMTAGQGRGSLSGRLGAAADSGSLTSVQSSGSDSSSHTATASGGCEDPRPGSPLWKRKDQEACSPECAAAQAVHSSAQPVYHPEHQETQHVLYKVSETVRKRQYRVGLNLFNKKPERGISYLIRRGFLENSPQGVARFLISRKGLSKQMIGEYLGNLQSPFNMAVLECFADELDLCGMAVDVALRKFQSHFRMPGEAQKIERLMEVFSTRYCRCNQDVVARLRSPDTVFVLAFAIIMLNTDLHTPNIKPERRMKLDDFVKNLRGIDDCHDIDRDMLAGIYDRVKANEFKPGSDHVTQVMKVQSTIVGKKPNMALPHRRLVCYCRLYEVPDPYKKERPGVHQREVFLFNDLLVITKILSKKKNSVTYTFRQSFPLCGMLVNLFEVPYYPYGIRLSQRVDGKVLVTFNARNEHDRCKFAEDLRESVCEMDEMENLRIEAELERQKSSHGVRAASARTGTASVGGSVNGGSDNRDSGVADVEAMYACGGQDCGRGDTDTCPMDRERMVSADMPLKRSALSNSLLDIHEQFAGEKPQRRGSVGSLDSGMSISFQSTSASTVSRDSSPQNVQPSPGVVAKGMIKTTCHPQVSSVLNHPVHPGQPSFLGGLFNKRERKSLRSDESGPLSRSTEV